jgi:hypothetical protein
MSFGLIPQVQTILQLIKSQVRTMRQESRFFCFAGARRRVKLDQVLGHDYGVLDELVPLVYPIRVVGLFVVKGNPASVENHLGGIGKHAAYTEGIRRKG